MRIFKPEVFQGSLSKKHYFEGWYFKHVSKELDQVYAFIPGISLHGKDKHAFIQVINGISGESHYIEYHLNQFSWNKKVLEITIGESFFSDRYIDLNIAEKEVRIKGKLDYINPVRYPGNMLAPGIMGWYSYVPLMECYHGVVSTDHGIAGSLEVNDLSLNFTGGKGYIEKDWGRSFPECWIWLQSNSFQLENTSLFFSVAKIPWIGRFFMGFISFLYIEGQYYKFSTYNGAKLEELKSGDKRISIRMTHRQYTLKISAEVKKSGDLVAPIRGEMNRRIKESIDSNVSFELFDNAKGMIFSGHSQRAGLEVIEGIFTYFPD